MSLATSENRVRKAKELLDSLGHTGRTTEEKYKHLFTKFFENLASPPRIDLDDWMDEHFYLPAESSSEHGRWRTQRFPFLRKIAKKLSPTSPCQEIGACKGAQIGFTTVALGWKLFITDQALGPTLYIQPTKESVTEYSEQKLEPSILMCKKIEDKLGEKRPKHLASTKLRKYFPGGYLALGSANSAPTLRSKSIRNLIGDEEDGFNQDVSGEGSAIHLAMRRTANFPDSKIFRLSTPVLKETTSIEPYCEGGTAERYLVPCPDCNPDLDKYGTFFHIEWDNIKYTDNDPRTAECACPACGVLIPEFNKTWMLDNAMWYRYNPTPIRGLEKDPRREKIVVMLEKHGYHNLSREDIDYIEAISVPDEEELRASFYISSLYSPLGFYSWQEAVRFWIDANQRNDVTLLKTFFNTVLGKSFSSTVADVDHRGLAQRQELYSPYGDFDLPNDVLVVVMGVDVQKDRLEAQVIGIGKDDEEFIIDYKIFLGDTAILGDTEYKFNGHLTAWGQLHEFLGAKYRHQSGHIIPIECTLIDARYRSQYGFRFCKEHEMQRVYGVYGKDGWGNGFIQRPVKKNRYGVWVFDAMQDELKLDFYSKLRNESPGPKYVHFSRVIEYPKFYFKGLVIEQFKTKRTNGNDIAFWENPPGGRNEPLDTRNYAFVAYLSLRLDLNTRRRVLDVPPGTQAVASPSGQRRIVRKKQ